MAMSLVDTLSGSFQSRYLQEAAAQLGESESSVLRGFQTTTAAILGGLSGKITQSGFLRQAYDLVCSATSDGKVLDTTRSAISGVGTAAEAAGGKLVSLLFGGRESTVSERIGEVSGLHPGSASKIMSIAAPAVLGMLGTKVAEEHLDASGFANLLNRELPSVRSLVPASLAGLVGITPSVPVAAKAVEERRSTSPLIWLAVLLIGALGLWWLFARGRDVTEGSRAALGEFYRTALANGVELNIPKGGIEARVLQFIQDSSLKVDKETWFDFDRLSFDTNSATLRPESQEQLGNITAILKAYPPVHVKIGGYTDSTGVPAANLQLSKARAESVRQQLISAGIAPERIEAEGYGEQFPVADNSTEEGRAKNRRISLRVTQK